jgi:hypothetical protein
LTEIILLYPVRDAANYQKYRDMITKYYRQERPPP